MRGIRGAITVIENEKGEILAKTKVLLTEIIKANELKIEDLVSMIFSATQDLDAEFPAKAVQELGWDSVPRLCTTEINVKGAVKKCIRVLVHVNTNKSQTEIKHIYLEGATVLKGKDN